jgi:hypothetical protein
VAAYSAVIELRVDGVTQVTRVLDTINKLDNALVSIKKTPLAIDSKNAVDGIRVLKKEVDDFARNLTKGQAQFASTTAGINNQAQAFKMLAANTKIAGQAFNTYIQAAEQASQKSRLTGGLAEIQATSNLYKVGRTAPTQSFKGVEELVKLGEQIPRNTASLNLYRAELERVIRVVDIGGKEFRELEQALYKVDVALGKTQFGPAAPPVQGPALPPNFIPRRANAGARGGPPPGNLNFNPNATAENLALGAGFPLLFGGGAGQVAGGLAGSFFGGGFGGQILGSAIGQILEDAQRRITEIGNALDMLDMDKLRESVVFVNAELDTTVRRLIEAGDAQTAQAIAADAVATQTGMIPQAVADISGNANMLVNIWNQFLGAVSGTLSIIGVPFVSALSLILSGFTKILQYTNLLVTTVGAWGASLARQVMDKFPWIARYYNHLLNGAKAVTEEEEKRNAVLQATIDKQVTQNYNTAKNLALEKQRTLGRTAAEKLINLELDRGLETNRINAEYEEKVLQFRRDNASATTAQLQDGIRGLQVQRDLAIEQSRIKTLLQEQGLEIEANKERYDRAAEAVRLQISALETSNQVRTAQLSAEAAINDLYGAQLERQYRLATTATERYNIAIAQFRQQVRAAEIEYTQAILNNRLLVQKAELQARLVQLKYRELVAEKQIAIAQAVARGNTPEQINRIASAYDNALGVQRDALQNAYDQVAAAKQIAAYQNIVAAAIFRTRVLQAESALAQKLVSDEIGMSKYQADLLASAMGYIAQQTINTESQTSQLVGTIQVGTQKTQLFADAMSDVAANAQNAAYYINRAFIEQQRLNAARGAAPSPKKKAADGAFWAGGFKAFAKGGVVNRPTLGLIGEGGESEYIVPESKAAGFATSYLFGKRGEDAIPSEGSGAGAPPLTINVTTGPVMEFDGQRYVTVADMERAMRLTAEGVIGRLRTPSARIALGMAR